MHSYIAYSDGIRMRPARIQKKLPTRFCVLFVKPQPNRIYAGDSHIRTPQKTALNNGSLKTEKITRLLPNAKSLHRGKPRRCHSDERCC
jgi:hypothetical protein